MIIIPSDLDFWL